MTLPDLPLFDGHSDSLTRFHKTADGDMTGLLRENRDGHMDLPRARQAGLIGGLFAINAPNRLAGIVDPEEPEHDDGHAYRFELSPPLPHELALDYTREIIAGAEKLAAGSGGRLDIVRDSDSLKNAIRSRRFAMVLHLEGAEAVSENLDNLDELYDLGIRSIGLVWSRPNCFGHGVPFAWPQSPDTGPGLTEAGKELVKALNGKGILVDLSHLNEKGFWDVARLTAAPMVASHSNAWGLSRSTRNLTDRQLEVIAESNGLVGVNFCVGFLRSDGRPVTDTPLSIVADHVDYMVKKIGPDHVAFGSDFDGATILDSVKDVGGYPGILALLRERGYADHDLGKIACGNWLRVLRDTWSE